MDYFNILLLILGLSCPFANSIEVLSREDETKLLENPVQFALIFNALQSSGKVDPGLLNLYSENHTARYNVFISFTGLTPCLILDSIADEIDANAPKEVKALQIYKALLALANEAQKTVENLLVTVLFALIDSYYKLWITNQIYVKSASAYVISILAGNPYVASILPDILVQLIYPLVPQLGIRCHPPEDVDPWGVAAVNANQVHLTGTKGQNVIIAIIDTGVDGTHFALFCTYIGNANNGWLDGTFTTLSTIPVDDFGHGTHVMGILLGRDCTNTNTLPLIGIAPLAVWRACKGLNALGIGFLFNLLICFQWLFCPNPASGKCDNVPDIISNSWGSDTMDVDPNTRCMLKAMRMAGIIVVFAAGNAGSNCTTVGSPGVSSEVITVGATSKDRTVAYFSSRGPGNDEVNIFKPDLAAPGHFIWSSWPNNSNQKYQCYALLSGTSMATPNGAGVVALIISKAKANNLTLSFEAVLFILSSTASKDLTPSSPVCGTGITKPPGYVDFGYGYGIVNAFAAYTKVAGCTTLICIYS